MRIGDWEWLDWNNVPGALDWIAFILGGLGIFMTLVQLFKSRGALNAARDALIDTRFTLMRNQLLAVLPMFREISRQLDESMAGTDRNVASELLSRFCYQAQEAASLLDATTSDFDEIVFDMRSCSDSAGDARAGLFRDPTSSISDIVSDSATEIRNLAARISGAAVTIKNDPGRARNA